MLPCRGIRCSPSGLSSDRLLAWEQPAGQGCIPPRTAAAEPPRCGPREQLCKRALEDAVALHEHKPSHRWAPLELHVSRAASRGSRPQSSRMSSCTPPSALWMRHSDHRRGRARVRRTAWECAGRGRSSCRDRLCGRALSLANSCRHRSAHTGSSSHRRRSRHPSQAFGCEVVPHTAARRLKIA